MTRTATWERIGMDVSGARGIEEILSKASLDFMVEKTPVLYQASNGDIHTYENKFITRTSDGNKNFGIVGKDYSICQNLDAFDFVQYIEDDIKFVKAGITATGRVFIIGEMPEQYVLGDSMKPYVIFQNSFDGSTPVQASIVPLRIICQNQFAMAFKNSENTINIRHSALMGEKMDNAKEILKVSAQYMRKFEEEAEKLATINIKGKEEVIIKQLFPYKEDASSRVIVNQTNKAEALVKAYNMFDNQNFVGTGWGLVNAFADYNTHGMPLRETNGWRETKFIKTTFDTRETMKLVEILRAA